MYYDPILCMNIPNKVIIKDGLDDPEKNAGYTLKKEGLYYKVYKNNKLVAMSSTEENARREAARHRAANQDSVHGFNAQMHNYNNAKARGNKKDMKRALIAASVELSDYEDSNTKKRAKNELNGKLRENGMKTIDKAIRMIDKNVRLEKLYQEAKKDYHNAMPILSDLKKEIKNKKDKIKSEKNGFKRKVLEQELSELNEYYSKIDSLV